MSRVYGFGLDVDQCIGPDARKKRDKGQEKAATRRVPDADPRKLQVKMESKKGGRDWDGGVSSFVNVTSVAAGHSFSMAIGGQGKVFGWGRNSCWQLGIRGAKSNADPVVVKMPTIVQVIMQTKRWSKWLHHGLA